MQTVTHLTDLREAIHHWRFNGETVVFVPTMGNLHAGHLHLVESAKLHADRVVVSIFVNPTQFSPGEDFNAYPRTPEDDTDKLHRTGADLLFMPQTDEVYQQGAATYVEVPGISDDLCGKFRPGHFRGVATVVLKLFNMVQPDVSLFGEKDWQQLTVIRRMVADLNMPVRIVGVPTVREPSGLAMSSRNAYLSEDEKQLAAVIYRSLLAAKSLLETGRRDYAAIEALQLELLHGEGFKADYFAIRRLDDLTKPSHEECKFIVLVAAWLGRARLIDNIKISL